MKKVVFLVGTLLALAMPAFAVDNNALLNACRAEGAARLGADPGIINLQILSARVDGSIPVNGEVEGTGQRFQCSFNTNGNLIEWWANNGAMGGSSGGSASSNIVQVTGVAANDVLNVRGGPGTNNPIVGALSNGTSVRNLGCQAQGNSRWCQIEMMTDMRERGWVNARYLTLGSASNSASGDGLSGTQDQFNRMANPCIAQASRLTGVNRGSITVLGQIRTGGGPLLTLSAAGTKYSCRLESNGSVTVFSEFAN
jgi:uncharacterized protein YgiM (DUF1202 family)